MQYHDDSTPDTFLERLRDEAGVSGPQSLIGLLVVIILVIVIIQLL